MATKFVRYIFMLFTEVYVDLYSIYLFKLKCLFKKYLHLKIRTSYWKSLSCIIPLSFTAPFNALWLSSAFYDVSGSPSGRERPLCKSLAYINNLQKKKKKHKQFFSDFQHFYTESSEDGWSEIESIFRNEMTNILTSERTFSESCFLSYSGYRNTDRHTYQERLWGRYFLPGNTYLKTKSHKSFYCLWKVKQQFESFFCLFENFLFPVANRKTFAKLTSDVMSLILQFRQI